MISKRKRNTRSKGLSDSAKPQVDGPHGWGRQSAQLGQMVCDPRVDSSKNTTEPLEAHLEKWTFQAWPPDGLTTADCPWTPRRLSVDPSRTVRPPWTDGPTNPLQQNFDTSKDPRVNSQELEEHAMNNGLTDCPRQPGELSARCGQSCSSPTSQRSTLPSHCSISQIRQGIATKS
jgi:hypothetical protein